MNTSGPVLLVLSAFLHALWNAFIKKSENKNATLFYIIVIATLFSMSIAPWTGGLQWGSSQATLYMIYAGAFEAGYFFSLTKTLELAPLGLGYAIMRGGAMLFVWLISTTWLGEHISTKGLVSVVLILLGIVLAHPRSRDNSFSMRGFLWALSAAVFIAGYHIFYGLALHEGASQVALFIGSMLVSFPVLAFTAGKKIFDFKTHFSGFNKYYLLLAGLFSAASFILFLYGLVHSGAGVAISLRNTSVAFAQLLAFFMGERLTKIQWFAFGCVLTGTVFLN